GGQRVRARLQERGARRVGAGTVVAGGTRLLQARLRARHRREAGAARPAGERHVRGRCAMILCGFDLEATGTDPWHDRIIEIALFRTDGRGYSTLVNPHRPIPPEATAVHGITDEDVADAPGFWAIAMEVQD